MAKTKAAPAPVAEATKEAIPRTRGPRGVTEDAVITVLAQANPKREGSKSRLCFDLYRSGMTVREFCDACAGIGQDGMGTPHLVYDTKHGFISIEGYEVPGGVLEPKPKKEKAPKEAKEPKAKKEKVAKVSSEAVEAAAAEEVMD